LSVETRSALRRIGEFEEGDTVAIRRGDDIEAMSPDIVKIDVEGLELDVIKGMKRRLSNAKVCYVEVHEGENQQEVISILEDVGLTFSKEFSLPNRPTSIIRFESHK